MNLSHILYIIFSRKWLLIIPPWLTVILATTMLMFVEPIYVSSLKLWNKERHEGSTILQVVRKDAQEDAYANVQREIIRSGKVLEKVIADLNLQEPAPSNSTLSIFYKSSAVKFPNLSEKQKFNEALKAMQLNVEVDIINAEIMVISSKANTARLALQIVEGVAKRYKEAYLNIFNQEIFEYEGVLRKRLGELKKSYMDAELDLKNFEGRNPDLIRKSQLSESDVKLPESAKAVSVQTPLPTMSSEMVQVNSLTLVLHELSRLEMKKSKLLTEVSLKSEKLKSVNEEINRNRQLLDVNLKKLSRQARLSIDHQNLRWLLNLARERYTVLVVEIDKITLSRGTKMKQIGSIAVLDQATEPLYPIYPKKKMILMGAIVLGLLTGLACVYFAQLSDPCYRVKDEVIRELGIPVICVLPLYVTEEESD